MCKFWCHLYTFYTSKRHGFGQPYIKNISVLIGMLPIISNIVLHTEMSVLILICKNTTPSYFRSRHSSSQYVFEHKVYTLKYYPLQFVVLHIIKTWWQVCKSPNRFVIGLYDEWLTLIRRSSVATPTRQSKCQIQYNEPGHQQPLSWTNFPWLSLIWAPYGYT